jgi:DNA (cytosine-5)-methyltransferase 1
MQGGHQEPKILQRIIPEPVCVASRGRNLENPSSRKAGEEVAQRLEVNQNGTSNTLTSVQKDNYVMVPSATKRGYEKLRDGDSVNLAQPRSRTRRGRRGKGISNTLDTSCNIGVIFIDGFWWWVRKLTPRECLRLQDFPDSFHIVVSNSQAYKQAGNSMSVNVIEMIFGQIQKALDGVVPKDRLF